MSCYIDVYVCMCAWYIYNRTDAIYDFIMRFARRSVCFSSSDVSRF